MSLLKNTFLELPLQRAFALYNDQVVPKLTQKNKAIAISAAVAVSLIYYINEKIMKPPKSIRHIPHIGTIQLIRATLRDESVWDRCYNMYLPELHSKGNRGMYSEYSRTGWVVNVSNPEDAKKIFMKHDIFPKLSQLSVRNTLSGKFLLGPNLLFLNGHEWKSQRKVANPAFHRSMPVKMFGCLTQDLFKTMESIGETVNVSDLMERWTLDAIGRAGFGFDFHAVANKNSKWVVTYNSIKGGLRDPLFFLFPSLDTTFLWMFPKRKALHRNMADFLEMLDDVIKHKRNLIDEGIVNNDSLEDNEKDLLSLMIESKEEDGNMSDEELKSNLCLFFMAGHDTTANTLSFAIHYLAKNPEIQQKAREEAISILGDDPVDLLPSTEDTKKMTYITQIMKETLRIRGPVTRLFPRLTTKDIELSGTFIPKGTQVSVNMFDLHHNDQLWKDSAVFNPDRFSENGEGVRGAGEGLAWAPFGNGARQCIGMNFSITEQRVMLSMLLRKFTWETPVDSIHKNGLICNSVGLVGPIDLDISFHKRY